MFNTTVLKKENFVTKISFSHADAFVIKMASLIWRFLHKNIYTCADLKNWVLHFYSLIYYFRQIGFWRENYI